MGAMRTLCAEILAILAEVEELPESMSRREELGNYRPLMRTAGVAEVGLGRYRPPRRVPYV